MKVKEAIEESGLTRAQVARDSGLSEAAVWAWLRGARNPSSDSLRKLAAGLRRRRDKLDRIADELERTADEA